MNTGCIGAYKGFLTKAAWVGALSLAACGAAWSQSADMLGVNYPANTRVEGVPLVLNGSGVNYRGMAKQYTLALYRCGGGRFQCSAAVPLRDVARHAH